VQAIVDTSGKFLYVSNLNDAQGAISAYDIDSATGALTPIPGSPFPTQTGFSGPAGLRIAGGGKFLYVGMAGTVNANHLISCVSINPSTGALTQTVNSPFLAGHTGGSPFTTHSAPVAAAVDPTGKFVYVPNSGSGDLSVLHWT